jgi:hypothetical protein
MIGRFLTGDLQGQTHYVPLYHSVYRVLDHLFAARRLTPPHQQRPYTRLEVREWLAAAAQTETDPVTLQIIARYREEFDGGEIHTLRYFVDERGFYGDAILRGSSQGLSDRRPFHRIDVGGNIRGYLGSALAFQTDIVTTVFLGNLDLMTGYGIKTDLAPVKHKPWEKTGATDWVQNQITASFPWGYVSFGNDLLAWGPARSGHLLLDLNQYALPNLHGVVRLGRLRFTQVMGVLNRLYPYVEQGEKRHRAEQRKIVAHRLDVYLGPKFQFGISESVIYNREWELAYLNPLLPLTVSELGVGDKDNNLAGVDLTLHLTPDSRTYAELFVDDVDLEQNLFTYYGNKWAALVGQQWSRPLGLERVLLTLEVVRVEPWVYSHRDSANIYEFYGRSIGYDLEPNSLQWLIDWDWWLRADLWCRLSLRHTRHGEGDRVFGRPEDPRAPKTFLSGPVERRTDMTLTLEYEFYQNMWLRLALWYETVRNERVDDTWDAVGGDRRRSGVRIGFDLNY